MKAVRLGTRGSSLARRQSALVADLLRRAGAAVELVPIVTEGDVRPPDTAWGEGAFVGALEAALRRGEIDLAVHSAKDVPLDTDLPIAAYPLRADPRDALVTRIPGTRLAQLPNGALVGTDSPRRAGFLRAAREDLRVVPLHGNVDTRLRKLDGGEVDALVLASAGLERLDRVDRIGERLEATLVPPAPGQGALAVQLRGDDAGLARLAAAIDDPRVRLEVETERALLRRAGGGCRAPLGALARADETRLTLVAGVVEPDGSRRQLYRRQVALADAPALARELADLLLAAGYRPAVSVA